MVGRRSVESWMGASKSVLRRHWRSVRGAAAAGSDAASRALPAAAVGWLAAAEYAKGLDWSSLPPSMVAKLTAAGTRGEGRSLSDAVDVWRTLPESLRALGPDRTSDAIDGMDWSHITARSRGGSDDASNGVFELASLNRSRGAETMSHSELDAARSALDSAAFQASAADVVAKSAKGAAVAAATALIVASLEHGLQYRLGEIDRDEMLRRVASEVGRSAAAGAAASGALAAVALAFPAVIPAAVPALAALSVIGALAMSVRIGSAAKGWWEHLSGEWRAAAQGAPGNLS